MKKITILILVLCANYFAHSQEKLTPDSRSIQLDLDEMSVMKVRESILSATAPPTPCDNPRTAHVLLKHEGKSYDLTLRPSHRISFANPMPEHPFFEGECKAENPDEVIECDLILVEDYFYLQFFVYDKTLKLKAEELEASSNGQPVLIPVADDPLINWFAIASTIATHENDLQTDEAGKLNKEQSFHFVDPNAPVNDNHAKKEDATSHTCTLKTDTASSHSDDESMIKYASQIKSNEWGKRTFYYEVHPYKDYHQKYGDAKGKGEAMRRLKRFLGKERQTPFHEHGHKFWVFDRSKYRNIVIHYVKYKDSPVYKSFNHNIKGSSFAWEVRRLMASFSPKEDYYLRALLLHEKYKNKDSESLNGQAGSIGSYTLDGNNDSKYFFSVDGRGNRTYVDCHEIAHTFNGRHPKGKKGWHDNTNQDSEYGHQCNGWCHLFCWGWHYGLMSYANMTNVWMNWNANKVNAHYTDYFSRYPKVEKVYSKPLPTPSSMEKMHYGETTGNINLKFDGNKSSGACNSIRFHVQKSGYYEFKIIDANYDTYLYLTRPYKKTLVASNDDYSGLKSRIYVYLSFSYEPYEIVVSGYKDKEGYYELSYKYHGSSLPNSESDLDQGSVDMNQELETSFNKTKCGQGPDERVVALNLEHSTSQESLQVAPNPVKSNSPVEIRLQDAENDVIVTYQLINAAGSIVYELNESEIKRIPQLDAGTYILQVTTNLGKTFSKKLLIVE